MVVFNTVWSMVVMADRATVVVPQCPSERAIAMATGATQGDPAANRRGEGTAVAGGGSVDGSGEVLRLCAGEILPLVLGAHYLV